jgi:hypothetical protein
MKVITLPHPYNFWGNYRIPEGLEFDIPKEVFEELHARGFVADRDNHLAAIKFEKERVDAYWAAKKVEKPPRDIKEEAKAAKQNLAEEKAIAKQEKADAKEAAKNR